MMITESWEKVPIGRFVELINGFAFPSEGFTDGEGTPLIRIRDLDNQHTAVNFSGKYDSRYLVKKGDLLIGMDGDFLTVKWRGCDALLNQRVCKLITKDPATLSQDFLFYRVIEEVIRINRITAATTVKHLSSNDVLGIEIEMPPTPEQTKIAEILSTVDRAIEQTEALIAKQQRIKTGLMQDLLTRGIDEHGNLRSEQTHKFKDSPLGRIPVEWDVKQLGFLCELIKDGTHLPPARVSEGPLLLGVYNIVNGKLTRSSSDTRVSWDFYRQMHQNWSIQTDDVLLAIVGATIGKTCLAPSDFEPYTLQRSVALIRGKQGVLNNRFLLQYLKSPLFQSIIHTKTNTTAQAGLYLSQIADFNFPICPIEEQIAITAKLEEIGKLGESYQQTAEKLRSLKTALMQDLLTGKKRVTALMRYVNENDNRRGVD